MIHSRRTLAVIAATGAGLLLATACSSSSSSSKSTSSGSATSSSTSPATSSGTSTATTSTSSSAPPVVVAGKVGTPQAGQAATEDINATARSGVKTGGKMTWGLESTVPNWNYNEVDGTLEDAFSVELGILPSPFNFNASGVPSVNTDYFTSVKQTSTSPQTIDFKINPKAKWSDGKPLSWLDIKDQATATSGKAKGYNISGSQGYDQIGSVKMGANAREAIVTFAKPYADWQGLFQPLYPASLDATAAAFNKGWTDHPLVTSGPFKWSSQDKTAQSYTVVRDPKWWGAPAKLDSIVYKVYNDPSAAVQALGSHQLDYYDISGGAAFQNITALKKYKGVVARIAGGVNYRQTLLNTKDPLLADIKVRQAITLGIDRDRITNLLIGNLGGNPTALNNHLFMKNQAAYVPTCGGFCKYNPTLAKQLLQSDGWTLGSDGIFAKAGVKLQPTIILPADTPNATQEAETMQATLKPAGIGLIIKDVPSNDFFPKYVDVAKFQMTTFTWIGTQFPVGGALSIYRYDPKNLGQNFGSGGNAQITAQLNQSIQSLNVKTENLVANQADANIWTNAAWLPLYQRPQVYGVNSSLANIGAYGLSYLQYQNIGYKS